MCDLDDCTGVIFTITNNKSTSTSAATTTTSTSSYTTTSAMTTTTPPPATTGILISCPGAFQSLMQLPQPELPMQLPVLGLRENYARVLSRSVQVMHLI